MQAFVHHGVRFRQTTDSELPSLQTAPTTRLPGLIEAAQARGKERHFPVGRFRHLCVTREGDAKDVVEDARERLRRIDADPVRRVFPTAM